MEFLSNLHPQIVHFPIAILILYAVFELIGIISKKDSLQKTAHLLLAIGVLTAIAAVLTGNQAAELVKLKLSTNFESLIEEHETFATITLWYFFATLVLRTYLILKKKFNGVYKYLFIPIVLVGVYFIYQTGNHGGKLVYKYGIGTEVMQNDIIKPINEIKK
jgi:uncharacterized membrane protein